MNYIINFLRKNKYLAFFLLFCLVSFSFVRASLVDVRFLRIKEVELRTPQDVVPVNDSLVTPVIYPNIEGLDSLEGEELKQSFVNVILPAVLIAKHRIDSVRQDVVKLKRKKSWLPADSAAYHRLADKYEAENIDNLILKMETHPNSIVLAQAAMESGWGTSRFFRQANNLFGIWSFDPNEPRIRAAYKRGSKAIYVKKYEDVSESIEDYFLVLAKSNAYEGFRKSRVSNHDPFEMVNHLVYYSETRWKYVRLIKLLMRKNDFTKYDDYRIDPKYFITQTKIKWLN